MDMYSALLIKTALLHQTLLTHCMLTAKQQVKQNVVSVRRTALDCVLLNLIRPNGNYMHHLF